MLLGAGLWSLLSHAPATACAVCYGAADNDWIGGARWAALFLLAVTYLLLGAGVLTVVMMRRKLKKGDGTR